MRRLAPALVGLGLAACAATPHALRDLQPYTGDGHLRAYIEIPRGVSEKWEYDPATNARRLDRTLDASLGGYPVNYGFVPRTLGWDGDPFDVLVLGPPLPGGAVVDGVVLGVMHMEDEKGRDDKVVIARVGPDGRPSAELTESEKTRIAEWFVGYKALNADAGKWAKVTGWSDAAAAREILDEVRAMYAR